MRGAGGHGREGWARWAARGRGCSVHGAPAGVPPRCCLAVPYMASTPPPPHGSQLHRCHHRRADKFTSEQDVDRQKFELLLAEKNEQEMEYEEKLKAAEERSQLQLAALDTQYQVRLCVLVVYTSIKLHEVVISTGSWRRWALSARCARAVARPPCSPPP